MTVVPDNSNRSLPRFDLNFWYTSGFGSPVGRAQGIGYVQELVARLTKTPIQTVCYNDSHFLCLVFDHCYALSQHNSTTNSTLDDNPITFPLDGRALYVDATHEVTVVNGELCIMPTKSPQTPTDGHDQS